MSKASTAAAVPTRATICRIYRLLLRHAGASVLYSKPAMPNLRRLYRPEMDIWMRKVRDEFGGGEAMRPDQVASERVAEWEEFAKRVSNTLSFLHRSSTHKDITHRVTSNLSTLQYRMDPAPFVARNKMTHSNYQNTVQMSRTAYLKGKNARKQGEIEKLQAWDALADTLSMAEGSSGLLLGKLSRQRKDDGRPDGLR